MEPIEVLILFVIAAVCGWLGKILGGYRVGGLIVSVVVGFVGALVGIWLKNSLDMPALIPIDTGSRVFPMVWAVLGAALVVAVLSVIGRRRAG